MFNYRDFIHTSNTPTPEIGTVLLKALKQEPWKILHARDHDGWCAVTTAPLSASDLSAFNGFFYDKLPVLNCKLTLQLSYYLNKNCGLMKAICPLMDEFDLEAFAVAAKEFGFTLDKKTLEHRIEEHKELLDGLEQLKFL